MPATGKEISMQTKRGCKQNKFFEESSFGQGMQIFNDSEKY
jgi:hypothetical protein